MNSVKVLFATTRGTGHFNPLVQYAKEMSRRGHNVAFASRIELADRISALGFKHFVLDRPDQKELEAIWARTKGLSEEETIRIYVKETFGGVTARAALPSMRDAIADWSPDLVVRETVEFSSIVAAQAAGIPHARVEVHAAQGEERYSYAGVEALDALREGLGLSADGGDAYLSEPAFSSFPKALDGMVARRGVPTFRVGPSDTRKRHEISDASWARDNGRPLVYVTFGTETQNFDHAKSIYRVALEAVSELPIRALMTTGSELSPDVIGAIPVNTIVLPWVAQADVFPLASAMLHHGGSGTLLGGLAAGLPMVIAPLFADQPINAKQVEEAGAGLAVLDPSPDKLRSAIERVLAQKKFQNGAKGIAADMAKMPNIKVAVDKLLESIVG